MNDHAPLGPLTVESIAASLMALGLAPGDQVMVHSDLRRFGMVRGADGRLTLALSPAMLYQAVRTVIGSRGTVIVPTFSYSWTRGEAYSVEASPSFEGSFSEYVRTLPGAVRSLHPLMSVTALGPAADELTRETDRMSFGADSPFARMHQADSRHLTVGVSVCSFSDYVQWACRVPYRYVKRFSGWTEAGGRRWEDTCEHCVRYVDQGLDTTPIFDVLNRDQSGRIARTPLRRIPLRLVSSGDLFALMQSRLVQDAYAFSARPKDEKAIACLARAIGPTVGEGPAVTAINQNGRERWIWTVPGRFARLHLSIEGPEGPILGADQAEAYLSPTSGLSLSEPLSGEQLGHHLVTEIEEVTAARLRRDGWLVRPVGRGLPPVSTEASYRVTIEVRPASADGVAQTVAAKSWLVLLPTGTNEDTGASLALRLAGEQTDQTGTGQPDDLTDRLVERLLKQDAWAALLPDRPGARPPAPLFRPDLTGVRRTGGRTEIQRAG